MRLLLLLLALFGCAHEPPVVAVDELVSVSQPLSIRYERGPDEISADRPRLSVHYEHARGARRQAIIDEARELVFDAMTQHIIPAWKGTGWAFYGDSSQPREGPIACGYFVGTTLRHAGFEVDRIELGDQPAEWIIDTFVSRRRKVKFLKTPG